MFEVEEAIPTIGLVTKPALRRGYELRDSSVAWSSKSQVRQGRGGWKARVRV